MHFPRCLLPRVVTAALAAVCLALAPAARAQTQAPESDLKAAIIEGSVLTDLDMSCFDGRYVTGTVSDEYLAWVEGSQTS